MTGRTGRPGKIDPNALWRIVLLRGLGFDEAEIARKLGVTKVDVTQEAISYQLRKLKDLASPGNEDRVLFELMTMSSNAIPTLVAHLLEGARHAPLR